MIQLQKVKRCKPDKRIIVVLALLGCMAMGLNDGEPAYAAGVAAPVKQGQETASIHVYFNGNIMSFPKGEPFINKGQVMIPTTDAALPGIVTDYDPKTRTLSLTNGTASLGSGRIKVNSNIGFVHNKKVIYTVSASNIRGTLYVPLAFISDVVRGKLEWKKDERMASITFPQLVGESEESKGYLLDASSGVLYRKVDGGRIRALSPTNIKLVEGYYGLTTIISTKVTEDADLVTIQQAYGEPMINDDFYTLFVQKGKVIRQAKAHYWSFNANNIKLYNGKAVMNDGQTVRLIDSDGSVKETWNMGKLSGRLKDSFAVEGMGEGFILARSNDEGFLMLFNLKTHQSFLVYELLQLAPEQLTGFREDGIKFIGQNKNDGELRFELSDSEGQPQTFNYAL
ncbi:copper amine oxidase domain protein [Paenibacillus terrae HPL-003]|uniref:Copper amine oxidase domain protein n=1 Tax=Paenibacillus terrae (strain HPL-003) TaxID=985665 RepID=G7VQQ4_PAETH|nr:stalk domain-containing protein [Paenibacillus terrae]AET61884.1 copper amine oxidase domain protein [Paenibacillus terrae HPL-003]